MKEEYTRFPLQWPVGWRRTPAVRRQRAQFSKLREVGRDAAGVAIRRPRQLSVVDGLQRVADELRRFGVPDQEWIVSSNLQTRLDGLPYANRPEPSDPGVAVYFRLRSGGRPKVFACDKWTRVADNLAAIAGHIEALRSVERYGVGETEQVLAGYTALPPSVEDWRSIFGFGPDDTPTIEAVNDRYQNLMRKEHPDVGGDTRQAAKLGEARNLAVDELRMLQEA